MVTKKATSEKVDKPMKTTCINCKSEVRKDLSYMSRNPLISEPYTLCKACSQKIANESMDGMHNVLRILDIPFIPEVYKNVEACENMFSDYMIRLNNPRKKYDNGKTYLELGYADSPTYNVVTNIDSYLVQNDDNLRAYRRRWGKNWTSEDYDDMEVELKDMITQYGDNNNDLATINTYVEIIRTKKLMINAYDSNELTKGKDLSARLSALMKEANLQVVDQKNKDDEFRLGVEIDYAEDEPIIDIPMYKDLDRFEYYWKTFIVKHFARFIGQDKSKVESDLSDMEEYDRLHNSEGDV